MGRAVGIAVYINHVYIVEGALEMAKLTERTFKRTSTPFSLPSFSRFCWLSCSRIESNSAAYPRFSSWDFDCIRFKSQASKVVFSRSGVERSGLNPNIFSNMPEDLF